MKLNNLFLVFGLVVSGSLLADKCADRYAEYIAARDEVQDYVELLGRAETKSMADRRAVLLEAAQIRLKRAADGYYGDKDCYERPGY